MIQTGVILVLVYITSVFHITSANPLVDIPDDIIYDLPERTDDIATVNDINVADLLDSQRTILSIRDLLNNLRRRKMEKRTCNINTGSHLCTTDGYMKAVKDRIYLEQPTSPGKRKKRGFRDVL